MWKAFVDWLTYAVMNLSRTSHLGGAVNFFIYDTLKIFFLLVVIIFIVAIIRSFFPPERTRKALARVPGYLGNIAAATVGIATPFCTCSAVPLFVGFIEAGVPLGVTFSFLVASPVINEVALGLLWGLFGWRVAVLYVGSGLLIATVSGFVIGRLRLEAWVEEYVYQIKAGQVQVAAPAWRQRLSQARDYVREILRRVWPYVLGGIAVGAFIHGYAPAGLLLQVAGKGNPVAVPVAVLIGVPLYSNAAGIIPIVQVLMEKGMAMGTALAFMMAVTGLSLPEAIILRKVLKPKLLATFFGIVAAAIIITGYLFNAIL